MKATTRILLHTLDKMSDAALRGFLQERIVAAAADVGPLSPDRKKRLLRIAIEAAQAAIDEL